MNIKKLFTFLFAMILFSYAGYSQNFFKTLPKLKERQSQDRQIIIQTKVTQTDSSFGAFRPILVAAAYSLPDRHLMSGVGMGFQSITYNYETQKSYCNYSISAIGFAGGAIAPKNFGEVVSYGVLIGAVNNTVMAGAAMNAGKVNFVLSIGVNFNN